MYKACLASLLISVLGSCAPPDENTTGHRRVSIGTNPVGTIYFVIGGGIAKLFTEELGLPTRAVPHAGASVYIPLLANGEITLGLNSSLDSALAYRGEAPYTAPLELRALARVFVIPYAFFVKAGSGIERLEDLRGKRVVVEMKGNVSLASLNWAILQTAGLGEDDIVPIAVGGIEQGVDAVTEGRADAAPIAMGIPLLRKAHAGIPGGVVVLSLGDQASDVQLVGRAPGSRSHVVEPSPEFVGLTGPTTVAAFDTYVTVGTALPSEEVELLVRTLHKHWDRLQKDYPALRGTSASDLAPATNPLPYAAGAVVYFKEAGLWSDANEAQQQSLAR